jgi:hypothetical protein
MPEKNFSYLSPKCEARALDGKGKCGVFARELIRKGELVSLWGGRVITAEQLDPTINHFTQRVLQVDEHLYLETPEPLEPSDCFNHSCEPNVGLRGQIGLVAMRDIEPDEELNLDYAMVDATSYDEFDCNCGAANCRRRVTGNDWRKPELWDKYAGYFSPYLAKRIEDLKGR